MASTEPDLPEKVLPPASSGDTRINRQTLPLQVTGLLREQIMSGELQPGDRLAEKELCERFGISRTPLREALKVLAGEGLVRLEPQRGAYVSTITEKEIREIFPIIASLEALAGELAAENLDPKGLHALWDLHHEMVAAFEARDHLRYSHFNRAVHLAIFEAAGNDELLQLYRNLSLRIRYVRHTMRKSEKDWQKAVAEHQAFMAAFDAADGPEAGRLMRLHIISTAETMRNALSRLEDAKPTG